MKLLLLESVDGLGRPGDQVSVKDGYARNFLMPKRLAVKATKDALRMLDSLRRKADEEERAMISSMEELALKLKGAEVSVEARAYTLALLAMAVALYLMDRAIEDSSVLKMAGFALALYVAILSDFSAAFFVVASGVYFSKLETGEGVLLKKMMLVR